MIREALRYIEQWRACRRLNKLIARNKRAPATIEYARKREAGLLGHQRRRSVNA